MLLHEELRRAREELGVTQAELAARAGIPRNQVVRAEKGENITLDTLRKIAAHLPVESLTLLEKIPLKVDLLPHAEKVYFGAMKTLMAMTGAFNAALDVALASRSSLGEARADSPLPFTQPAPGGEVVDDLLLLRSMKNSVAELNEKLRDSKIA